MESFRDFKRSKTGDISEDDARLLADEAPRLVDGAAGSSWYEVGSEIDLAAARLCLLRRAGSTAGGSIDAGDEAVRDALERAKPEAVVWLATRAVSYMDEQGFPDFVPGAHLS